MSDKAELFLRIFFAAIVGGLLAAVSVASELHNWISWVVFAVGFLLSLTFISYWSDSAAKSGGMHSD